MSLREYLAEWDPYGLIEAGINNDEYAREAREIRLAYSRQMSDIEVGQLVYDVFIDSFEHDFPGLKEDCLSKGSLVRRAIEESGIN